MLTVIESSFELGSGHVIDVEVIIESEHLKNEK